MFRTAFEDDLIPVNPVRIIRFKSDSPKRRKAFTIAEYRKPSRLHSAATTLSSLQPDERKRKCVPCISRVTFPSGSPPVVLLQSRGFPMSGRVRFDVSLIERYSLLSFARLSFARRGMGARQEIVRYYRAAEKTG